MLGNTPPVWPDVNSLHFCVNNKLMFVIYSISEKTESFPWSTFFFFLSRKRYITNNRAREDIFSERRDSGARCGAVMRGISVPVPAPHITKDQSPGLCSPLTQLDVFLCPQSPFSHL